MKVTHSPKSGFQTLKEIRASHREDLRQQIVEAAAQMVATYGAEGLTIKRLAADFGSSIGTIYRYFQSKELLLAAVEATWIDDLAAAASEKAEALSERLSSVDAEESIQSLAKVIDASVFWIDAFETQPTQLRHARHLVGNPHVAPDARTEATTRVLTPLAEALAEAGRSHALQEGDVTSRAGMIATIVPVPTCAPHLWEAPAVDTNLGHRLLECLLHEWGASPADITRAKKLVDISVN